MKLNQLLATMAFTVAAVALVIGVVLTYNQWTQSEKAVIDGTISLNTTRGVGVTLSGSTCDGSGGYSDITQGSEVELRDATGKLIAVTKLGNGAWGGNIMAGRCTFYFRFDDVELEGDDDALFTIQIGNENRGGVTYSRDKLLQGPVTLSIG